jgi:hypothetical protein
VSSLTRSVHPPALAILVLYLPSGHLAARVSRTRSATGARSGHTDAVAPRWPLKTAMHLIMEGDARLRGGHVVHLRERDERVEDITPAGLILGCSVGGELKGGGCFESERALSG